MTIALRMRGEATVNGKPLDATLPAGGADIGDPPILIEGENKSCEIENHTGIALAMTVGDSADGGTQMEIPAGATVTVTGQLPVKLEAAHAE